MHVIKEIEVEKVTEPIRLINYCEGLFPGLPTKSSLKKAFKRNEIYLNGAETSSGHWLQPGDTIQWVDHERNPPKPYHLNLKVLFEDEHLAAVDKPAGIPVSGNQFRTLQNAAPFNLNPSSAEDALRWPKPAHRLDVPTSGIVLFAKTAKMRILLGQLFEEQRISKIYHAVVVGEPPIQGNIDTKIDGKDSLTDFELLRSVDSLRVKKMSLLRLHPKTGRTHQLRKHLEHIGHPIVGDTTYGEDVGIRHKGLFLCATKLSFTHPISGEELNIKNEIPHKFYSLLEREQRRWNKKKGDPL